MDLSPLVAMVQITITQSYFSFLKSTIISQDHNFPNHNYAENYKKNQIILSLVVLCLRFASLFQNLLMIYESVTTK